MWQPEDVFLILFGFNIGLVALWIWGEIRAERYWDEFERELENRRLSS